MDQQQNKYTYTLFVRELQRVGAATEQIYIYTICQGVTESWSSNRRNIHIHYLSESYRELEQQQNKYTYTLFVRELQRVGAATEQIYIYTICQGVTESWSSNRTNIHIHYLSVSYRELEQQQNKDTYTLFVRELQRVGAATEQIYINYTLFVRELQRVGAATEQRYIYTICQRVTESWSSNRTNIHKLYTICQGVTESWSSNRTNIHIHYLSGSYRELEQQQNKYTYTLFVRELQRVGAATEQIYIYTICQRVTESWSSNRTNIHIHYLSESYRELEQQQNKYTYTLFVRELQRVGTATEQIYIYTICQGVTESWSSNRTNIHIHYLSESYRELEQQQNKYTYTLFVRELQRVGAATEQIYIYTICQRVTESWNSNRTNIHIHYLSGSYRELEQHQNKYTYTLFVLMGKQKEDDNLMIIILQLYDIFCKNEQ